MIPLLLLFHGLVWYNQLQTSAIVATQKVIFDDTDSKSIFLTIKGKQTRFKLSKKQTMKIQQSDTVVITVKQGALGYNYFSRFDVVQQP